MRKMEYYLDDLSKYHYKMDRTLFHAPKHLLPQERDWTCAVAVFRSLLADLTNELPSEDDYIKRFDLKVNGHYSDEMREWLKLTGGSCLCGCDHKGSDISDLFHLLDEHYLTAMMYRGHWYVLLGYLYTGDYERNYFVLYCPYYNEMQTVRESELLTIWETEHCDYFAVPGRSA